MKYNPEVNRLRGIAVCLTLFAHSHMIGGRFLTAIKQYLGGNGGVILFFVISGFVISASLDDGFKRESNHVNAVARFWIKRFTRIFPQALLWIVMGVGVAVVQKYTAIDNTLELTLQGALAALTNTYNFFAIASHKGTILTPYWSLSLEEQFYIVFPFILVFVTKTRDRILLLGAVLMAVNLLSYEDRMWFQPEGIVFGIVWYEIWKRIGVSFNKMNKIYAFMGFVFVLFLLMAVQPMLKWFPASIYYLLMPSVSLVLLALGSLQVGFVPGSKFLDWLGTRSYALYLAHIPTFTFFSVVGALLFQKYGVHEVAFRTWTGIAAIFAAFGLAELSYRYIEQPIRRKGRDYANSLASPNNSVD